MLIKKSIENFLLFCKKAIFSGYCSHKGSVCRLSHVSWTVSDIFRKAAANFFHKFPMCEFFSLLCQYFIVNAGFAAEPHSGGAYMGAAEGGSHGKRQRSHSVSPHGTVQAALWERVTPSLCGGTVPSAEALFPMPSLTLGIAANYHLRQMRSAAVAAPRHNPKGGIRIVNK